MATKKRTVKKTAPLRSLTQSERKALSHGFYNYLNKIDALLEKSISPQTKRDLRDFKASLKKSSPHLHKF